MCCRIDPKLIQNLKLIEAAETALFKLIDWRFRVAIVPVDTPVNFFQYYIMFLTNGRSSTDSVHYKCVYC